MNTNVILTVTFTLIITILSAQKVELGLNSGAGYNLIISKSNKKYEPFKPYYTLSNGLSFSYRTPKYFFIRTDIKFDRLTSKIKANGFEDELFINGQPASQPEFYYGRSFQDYISLYFLPGFETNGNTKFFYYNGVFITQLLSYKNISWTSDNPEKIKRIQDVNLNIGVGMALGLGLKQKIGKNLSLSIESRINIPPNAFIKRTPFFNFSNNFLVGLQYSFNKKSKRT